MTTPSGRSVTTTRERNRAGRAAIGRLFDAATEVFGSVGYNAATVDDVVRRAGMARTTFYEYFTGKEDLFRSLLAEVAATLADHAATLEPIEDSPASRAALRAWVATFVALYRDHAGLLRAWTEGEVSGNGLGGLGPALYGETTRRMSAAMRAGQVQDVNAGAAAVAFVSMIERVNYYAAAGLLDAGGAALADTLTDVMLAALFGA